VTIRVNIPQRAPLELSYALLDVNGTLANRGQLIDGVAGLVAELRDQIEIRLLSADTFGQLDAVAAALGVERTLVADGDDKVRVLEELGPERCVAIGNGANDAEMLRRAALSIVVVGPEGAAGAALAVCDIVCSSILDALSLLRDERALAATLRH